MVTGMSLMRNPREKRNPRFSSVFLLFGDEREKDPSDSTSTAAVYVHGAYENIKGHAAEPPCLSKQAQMCKRRYYG